MTREEFLDKEREYGKGKTNERNLCFNLSVNYNQYISFIILKKKHRKH
jgi:hypothetical protein